MKQLLSIILSMFILSSCVAFTRDVEYNHPERSDVQTLTVVSDLERAWEQLILSLKNVNSPYTINSIDRYNRVIQISYSGPPCPYVDCGQLSAEFSNTGRIFNPPFSTPLLFRNTYPACREFLEYTVSKPPHAPWSSYNPTVKRTMTLEVSAHIRVNETSSGVTVTSVPIYEVIKKVKVYDEDGLFQGQIYDTITFGSYKAVSFPGVETTCGSNGVLENDIINMVKTTNED